MPGLGILIETAPVAPFTLVTGGVYVIAPVEPLKLVTPASVIKPLSLVNSLTLVGITFPVHNLMALPS